MGKVQSIFESKSRFVFPIHKRIISDRHTIERRSFEALHAGDIWQGDVLHGPSIQTSNGMRKTYLVSLMDDASRLITHSAFCLGETALDVEGVLKQAILKHGIPHKLIFDNGPAYRSGTLQSICALLEIRLIYCRPYEPEGKGKIERFHRTFRHQFLTEIEIEKITSLDDLNLKLFAWIEHIYHRRPHAGIGGKSPIERWRIDLLRIRQLGFKAGIIDSIFCHRHERIVRKDGTVSWDSKCYEVDFDLVDKRVVLVVDPHSKKILRIESPAGEDFGDATLINKVSNLNRKRQRPKNETKVTVRILDNTVDIACRELNDLFGITHPIKNQIIKERSNVSSTLWFKTCPFRKRM